MPYDTSEPRTIAATALAFLALLVSTAGQAQEIDEATAVQEAMRHNPSLRASLYEVQQAYQSVLAEEARYLPSLSVDTSVTHNESPRLSDESTRTSSSDNIDLGTQLSHTFPWGTSFSLRLEGNRASSTSQYGTGDDLLITTGPGYGLLGRLTVAQPLLRGFGTEIGEAELRQAKLGRTSAECARDRLASETLRDVLVAYWELWYAEESLMIDRAATRLAARRRDEAEKKLTAGAVAPVDVLPFETRVAELEQSVLSAQAQRHQQSLVLGLLLGRPAAQELRAAADTVPPVPERDRAVVLATAVSESQAITQQQVQLELDRERQRIAGENERPRLDLEAYVQTQGLGNRDVVPAIEQYATFGAVSAHVGLVFELPLSGARRSAQRRAAHASTEATRERLHATIQQLQTEAATQLVKLDQAHRRLALVNATTEIAEKNVEAQTKRYYKGHGIALEVHEAEDELRRARLTATRARVDAMQASVRIDHLTGDLLRRYGKLLPPKPSTFRHRTSAGVVRQGPF